METKRLCCWLLALVVALYLVSRMLERVGSGEDPDDYVRLDMGGDCAGYLFQQTNESDEVAIGCLQKELGRSRRLRRAWGNANCRTKVAEVSGLRREHLLAVNAYTQMDFHGVFNQALRKHGANDSTYAKDFPFKCFHYLLSVALERLRENSHYSCMESFRGMERRALGVNRSEMRFGFFASSSLRYRIAEHFGGATIFTIRSQYGVLIQRFSEFPVEEEVLIPPDEVFRIGYPEGSEVDVILTSRGRQATLVKLEEGEDGRIRVARVNS
ncbi:erythroblast NAD(P)(+)--arginine ADP-ribosyltransferase-like [Pristis pectinata]|uniref:erythroblast NAD(P)(+)--arginine ADP-ribosyltransferase-like n=1 Tax=Pristis pectinata TaxID=685728 RepID=UPI00223D828A|nr:erythroblast NAD(P)(+)--arginine ADP-ribosyltransferase-like [Pristis pectinata]